MWFNCLFVVLIIRIPVLKYQTLIVDITTDARLKHSEVFAEKQLTTYHPIFNTILYTVVSDPKLAQPAYTPVGTLSEFCPTSSGSKFAVGIPSSEDPRRKPFTTVPFQQNGGSIEC
eukprot:gb/GECG01008868.1/.p1 GENE.gb/GECG01008868.1/~~gb/GECG01008868.1/.p1  ORF type:complete len:116 (+),score=8.61 gb/GECG01008868.1/:1-348(+)